MNWSLQHSSVLKDMSHFLLHITAHLINNFITEFTAVLASPSHYFYIYMYYFILKLMCSLSSWTFVFVFIPSLLFSSLSSLTWPSLQDHNPKVSCMEVVLHLSTQLLVSKTFETGVRKKFTVSIINNNIILFKTLKYSRSLKTHEGPWINRQ